MVRKWRGVILAALVCGGLFVPYAQADSTPTGEIPTGGNIYLVELRVNFGHGWFRLATGPRPEDQARQLFVDLHRHLVPFRHDVTLYNVDSNKVDDEIKYEGGSDDASHTQQ